MSSLQPVRGTRDILGKEALLKTKILNVFSAFAKKYNFNLIETPIFESTSVFSRTLGETSDIVGKEMYTFLDRGEDSLTLRPEGTAPVIRALISNGLTQTLPQKFFYAGPMFRYERPQKGRYRQFHQACVEYIGSVSPFADVEVICFGYNLLKELGIKDIILHINTLGDIESRLKYREALIAYFTPLKKQLSRDSQERLLKNPLRILDSKDVNDQALSKNAPHFQNYLTDFSKDFFASVLKGLDVLNIPYVLDNTLVRGLDYYTHTAFEFKTTSLGAQDTVLAGGRYDNLVKQMGGPDIAAVGFGMGIERACLLMNEDLVINVPPIGILPIGESDFLNGLVLADTLRKKGYLIEFPLSGNLNKRFKQLERFDCRTVIVFGSDEWDKGSVKIKNLKEQDINKKEVVVHLEEIDSFLKEFA
jgi:histidyl-tRNA synthetase